jgi:hypothetical protein
MKVRGVSEQETKPMAEWFVIINKFNNTDLATAIRIENDAWFKGKYIAFEYLQYKSTIKALLGIEDD